MESRDKLRWLLVAWAVAWGYSIALNQLARLMDFPTLNVWLVWGVRVAISCAIAYLVMRDAMRKGAPPVVWQGAALLAASGVISTAVLYAAFAPVFAKAIEYDVTIPVPYPPASDPGFFLAYALRHGAIILTAYLTSRSSLRNHDAQSGPPSRALMAWSWVGLGVWVVGLATASVVVRWFVESGI